MFFVIKKNFYSKIIKNLFFAGLQSTPPPHTVSGRQQLDSKISFNSLYYALLLMNNFVYCSVRPTVGCPLSTVHYLLSTVRCLLSTVQFFLSKNLLQLIFRGQWTVDKNCKIVSRSRGGVLCNPGFLETKNFFFQSAKKLKIFAPLKKCFSYRSRPY